MATPPSPAPASASELARTTSALRPATPKPAQKKVDAIKYPFWFGGSASSLAACVTHPLDLGELLERTPAVRLQTRTGDMPKSMSGTFVHVARHNGVTGLYAGLSASLLRQLTYSTTRFGVYEEVKSRLTERNGGRQPSFPTLVAISAASGFLGGISGNAADVLNVRMQHDAALPVKQRRNYKHAFDGMIRMLREEGGIRSWFRGVLPNSLRAAAMTASQLASYDTFKKLLINHTPLADNLSTHFTASFLAGVTAATVTSPVDVIKTRVMSSTSATSSIPKLVMDIYAAEGMGWMFKGWADNLYLPLLGGPPEDVPQSQTNRGAIIIWHLNLSLKRAKKGS
ncbi:mitochondrial dicarboxylate carrier [Pyricularia oryzae 70-15]|uniref:Mitochondrial dicarboxylate carrier n=1 Tax=Pyricularia oryzae (strain 70-15 / ATCC MYA-4617 / FGSC 8958) TaxID=242507 RepID=G4N9Z2_PYRO7|nr:mitochondrial dicarboxylate carrier [Pyricularia oryzae 70-15]EHA50444.1 mitochondrial dicarboxylate carrier [Pyricularia oryzae 70-15]